MSTLRVLGLGKSYRIFAAEHHRVLSWFGFERAPVAENWAVRGIDFSVAKGESVGIVGRNGAGKSTLLKLIAGTLRPTEGHIGIEGHVAAILELGTGFNAEFTGRENARHALGLMGFLPAQIQKLLPRVEDFAEIGSHFEQPLRAYSSGMHMRLAFAVVTAHRPDLLIVDEALAVGDAYFQHKCLVRMKQFRDQGTSILFVSHDSAAVINLCDRAILLDNGRMVGEGEPRSVLDQYNSMLSGQQADRESRKLRLGISRYGNGRARILDVLVGNARGAGDTFMVGEAVWIEVAFRVEECIDALTVGFVIRDRFGNEIFGTNTYHLGYPLCQLASASEHRVRFDISRLALGTGDYHITIALHSGMEHSADNYDWWDSAAGFTVVKGPGYPFSGVVELPVVASEGGAVNGDMNGDMNGDANDGGNDAWENLQDTVKPGYRVP